MIGFQCSATVQPVFGRSPLFPANSHAVTAHAPTNGYHARPSIAPPNLLDYYPGLAGDGLRITWAHAVNSRSKLNAALMSKSPP